MSFCFPKPILYDPMNPPTPTCAILLDPSATIPFQVGNTPDPCFFNINGIYAMRYTAPFSWTFDSLYNYISSDINFRDISNLIHYPDPYSYQGATTSVKYMSNQQKDQYESQLTLFRQVYAFNYAAYVYAATNNIIPVYYRFKCSSELQTYNASLGLVNKLYNVSELFPYTCLFYMPFPPFCA